MMAKAAPPRSRPGLGLRGIVVLLTAISALAGWVYLAKRAQSPEIGTEPPSTSILRHIPRGAMLVATVDVAALRHTPLGEQLLGQGRDVAGLGEVTSICGADPMDAVERLAIAIPDAAQDTGFGLFASGPFQAKQLIGCAEKIVAKRGGRPVRVTSGRYTVLKDASLELSSAELAAAEGGPVILAEPAYVRAALGTEGGESVEDDEQHAALRQLVPAGQLVATAVLSAEQRHALIDELKAQNQADSPFRAVNGAALSLTIDAQLRLALAIRCDDGGACTRVAAHILRAAKSESETVPAKAIGLDLVLERMVVETLGDAVHVRLAMPSAEALGMLRRVLALRRLAEPGALPAPPSSGAPEMPPPPEAPSGEVGDAGVRIEAKPAPSTTP